MTPPALPPGDDVDDMTAFDPDVSVDEAQLRQAIASLTEESPDTRALDSLAQATGALVEQGRYPLAEQVSELYARLAMLAADGRDPALRDRGVAGSGVEPVNMPLSTDEVHALGRGLPVEVVIDFDVLARRPNLVLHHDKALDS